MTGDIESAGLKRLLGFIQHRNGGVAVMFAVAAIPLLGAIGAAVDYSTVHQTRGRLASALDAATLAAAGAQTSQSDLAASIARYLNANLGSGFGTPTVSASLDANGAVIASATLVLPTRFMKLFSIQNMTVGATSKASYGSGPVEVALVLDTTGSMSGAKIAALQQAASAFVTTLFASPGTSSSLKIGIVPFAEYVNVGLTYRSASWLTNTTDSSTTTNQCWDTYPNATYTNPVNVTGTCYNDGVPNACSWTNYTVNYGAAVNVCGPVTNTYTWGGCVGSRSYPLDLQDVANSSNPVPGLLNYGCSTPLQRLTTSASDLQTQIAALTANGETYIPAGLLWGWRLLSPNAPFADGAAYSSATRKIMVVMTDGANTHSANYPDHSGTDASAANTITAQTCANIKAAGIKVYTIAFSVSDVSIKSILAGCASGSNYYFDSSTISDMQTTFSMIARSIGALRLTQ